ncbi:MAG: hypothetical protein QOH46_4176 [Solirubrobacteraceae bacterium]|nr:hypothetical protein [Solirubrobacteraceae bacterium]
MSVNHRLSSREHLAEAAALHGEGALGPAVQRLRVAAVEAVAALAEPGPAGRLAEHGIPPAGVRDLLAELHLDCVVQERGEETEFTAWRVEQVIASVQQLADVATGLPARASARVGGPAARSAHDTDSSGDVVALPAVPERPGRWLAAARRRRRRGRVMSVIVPLATVAAVIGVGIAIAFARPERPPGHRLDVLSRTHEFEPRAAPRPDVR